MEHAYVDATSTGVENGSGRRTTGEASEADTVPVAKLAAGTTTPLDEFKRLCSMRSRADLRKAPARAQSRLRRADNGATTRASGTSTQAT